MNHTSSFNHGQQPERMNDIKMERRSFLKLTALSALALGAGYAIGKLPPQFGAGGETSALSLHAFLPGDSSLVAEVVRVFTQKTGPVARVAVSADPQWSEFFRAALKQGHLVNGGLLTLRMTALPEALPADILLGDNQQAVYAPERDYDPDLRSLQSLVRNRQAGYLFSADYRRPSLLAGLWQPQRLAVVIRSGSDIVERIPLERSYRQVVVDGAQGKTVFSVADGAVQVEVAACRNKLCMHSGSAAQLGSVIACAPNHLVAQVEAG